MSEETNKHVQYFNYLEGRWMTHSEMYPDTTDITTTPEGKQE